MKANELLLKELYSFQSEESNEDQRIVTVPTAALGTLKRELTQTIGDERAKGLLLRYGWHCGVSDGAKAKELTWDSELELMKAGPRLHSLHGYVEVKAEHAEVNISQGLLRFDGYWENSYEAQEHIKFFGTSSQPVCHSLVGYASGYLTTILGKKVIAKEIHCAGMGFSNCHWVAKTIDEWGPEINDELVYYEQYNIIEELNQTYNELKSERDSLNKAYQIHKVLMKELLRENKLDCIAAVLYKHIGMQVLIEDSGIQLLAAGGMKNQEAKQYSEALKQWHKENGSLLSKGSVKTRLLDIGSDHRRAITPIYLRQKIIGYCSFLYPDGETLKDVDKMILEIAAMACSLHLQNEQTIFSTEQRMRGSLLGDIISKRITMEEMHQRSHFIDFPLKDTRFFMIAFNRFRGHNTMKEELEFNDRFINDLSRFFQNRKIASLVGRKSGHVIILLSEDQKEDVGIAKKEKLCEDLLQFCNRKYPDCQFKLGVSSSSTQIEEASELYEETTACLNIAARHKSIVVFETLGVAGILFQTKNAEGLYKFAHKTLGKLIQEDKKNKNSELIRTLYYYLENASNVHKTARAMNFSISGLRYRLQRLNELLQLDIDQPNVMHQIYLALQSLIVLGELEVEE